MTVPLSDMNAVFNMAINHERQQSCGNTQAIPQVMCTESDKVKAVIPTYVHQSEVPSSQLNVVNFQ